MSNDPNGDLRPEPPEWMTALFEELQAMFEEEAFPDAELNMFEEFPDANELNLEKMQRGLDEQAGSL